VTLQGEEPLPQGAASFLGGGQAGPGGPGVSVGDGAAGDEEAITGLPGGGGAAGFPSVEGLPIEEFQSAAAGGEGRARGHCGEAAPGQHASTLHYKVPA
jgi:hypothetical protein